MDAFLLAVDFQSGGLVILPEKVGAEITWESVLFQTEWVHDAGENGCAGLLPTLLVSTDVQRGRESWSEHPN